MQRDYKAMRERDYPEEMEPGGFVADLRDRCQYMDKYPEQWSRESKQFREAYKENPEEAILQHSYEFLRSLA